MIYYIVLDNDDTLVNTSAVAHGVEPQRNPGLVMMLVELITKGHHVEVIINTHQDMEVINTRLSGGAESACPNLEWTIAWKAAAELKKEVVHQCRPSVVELKVRYAFQSDLYPNPSNENMCFGFEGTIDGLIYGKLDTPASKDFQMTLASAGLSYQRAVAANDKLSAEEKRKYGAYTDSNKETQVGLILGAIVKELEKTQEPATILYFDDTRENVIPTGFHTQKNIPILQAGNTAWLEEHALADLGLVACRKARRAAFEQMEGVDHPRVHFVALHCPMIDGTYNLATRATVTYDSKRTLGREEARPFALDPKAHAERAQFFENLHAAPILACTPPIPVAAHMPTLVMRSTTPSSRASIGTEELREKIGMYMTECVTLSQMACCYTPEELVRLGSSFFTAFKTNRSWLKNAHSEVLSFLNLSNLQSNRTSLYSLNKQIAEKREICERIKFAADYQKVYPKRRTELDKLKKKAEGLEKAIKEQQEAFQTSPKSKWAFFDRFNNDMLYNLHLLFSKLKQLEQGQQIQNPEIVISFLHHASLIHAFSPINFNHRLIAYIRDCFQSNNLTWTGDFDAFLEKCRGFFTSYEGKVPLTPQAVADYSGLYKPEREQQRRRTIYLYNEIAKQREKYRSLEERYEVLKILEAAKPSEIESVKEGLLAKRQKLNQLNITLQSCDKPSKAFLAKDLEHQEKLAKLDDDLTIAKLIEDIETTNHLMKHIRALENMAEEIDQETLFILSLYQEFKSCEQECIVLEKRLQTLTQYNDCFFDKLQQERQKLHALETELANMLQQAEEFFRRKQLGIHFTQFTHGQLNQLYKIFNFLSEFGKRHSMPQNEMHNLFVRASDELTSFNEEVQNLSRFLEEDRRFPWKKHSRTHPMPPVPHAALSDKNILFKLPPQTASVRQIPKRYFPSTRNLPPLSKKLETYTPFTLPKLPTGFLWGLLKDKKFQIMLAVFIGFLALGAVFTAGVGGIAALSLLASMTLSAKISMGGALSIATIASGCRMGFFAMEKTKEISTIQANLFHKSKNLSMEEEMASPSSSF